MTTAIATRGWPVSALPPLIGSSAAINSARNRLGRFAKTGLPILLVGPTGTGKEVIARHFHAMSARRGHLIDVNCAALPRDMMESLLFGHRRGAFTGAIETTVGLIPQADAGTLFLDELASLPLEGQAKLLRVLETGEVTPVGSSVKQFVDFRLVSAVHDDIYRRIESHQFRADLFHRIDGVTIRLPALSERREDIEPLAAYFAQLHGCTLEKEAVEELRQQEWPGNARQLRTIVDRATILTDAPVISRGVVRQALGLGEAPEAWLPLDTRGELVALCMAESGNAVRIAAVLGVSRATLYRRLKKYGLRLKRLSEGSHVSQRM